MYKYHEYIDGFINDVKENPDNYGKDIKKAIKLVQRKLNPPNDVVIESDMIYTAVEQMEDKFNFTLIPWERFIVGLIHCYYGNGLIVFKEFFLMIGRGNGKNGFISALGWYLSSHLHGIENYNVDIIANSEKQAMTSFEDIYDMLEDRKEEMDEAYSWNKEKITSELTNSYIQYNTSNPRTKDGFRPACIIFDELHEYESSSIINVFLGGMGKIGNGRVFYITTNGYVRGGVLDKQLEKMEDILNNVNGMADRARTLPLIFRLDDKSEWDNPKAWVKPNPSLPYFENLQVEMNDHFIDSEYDLERKLDFLTKRMNLPQTDEQKEVASWEKIVRASEREIPYDKLKGLDCIGAVDYAQVHDFCSVGLLFKYNHNTYWIEHTFVQKDILNVPSREFKFPVMEMVEKGLITVVDEPTIRADMIADWFLKQGLIYNIKQINIDSYRYAYLSKEFDEKGLPVNLIRSGEHTHTLVAPIITSLFREESIIWGDNPTMNWYTNNTGVKITHKGNTEYIKLEPRLRKTDGFFALVHALSGYDELENILEEDTEAQIFEFKTYSY